MPLDGKSEARIGRDVDHSESVLLSLDDVDAGTRDGRASDVSPDAVDRTRVRDLDV